MSRAKRILNATKSSTVCERAVLADGPFSRMRGLLGRRELPAGEGLLLTPAPSIHTAFMHFAIDALFLDADLRVLRIAERLAPWKAAGKRHARAVLELSAGEATRLGVQVGDRLELVDLPAVSPDTPALEAEPRGALDQSASAQLTSAQAAPMPTSAQPVPAQLETQSKELLAYRRTAKPPSLEEQRPEHAMQVMVLSTDRRFREVVSLLLARRGCAVSVGDGTSVLGERIEREHIEVVVIDAGRSLAAGARMAAAIEALSRPVGIVVVDDQQQPTLPKLHTIPKWGSFEELFAAVERAHAQRTDRPGLLEQTANGAPS
jgi:uncharacterized protein